MFFFIVLFLILFIVLFLFSYSLKKNNIKNNSDLLITENIIKNYSLIPDNDLNYEEDEDTSSRYIAQRLSVFHNKTLANNNFTNHKKI